MSKPLKEILNNRLLGVVIGFLLPFLTLIFVNMDYNIHFTLLEFLERLQKISRLSALLSLCAIPNLLPFFIFMKKKYYRAVWGIMFSMVILMVAAFMLKFELITL